MAVRIRVYPNNGMMGGMYGNGMFGAVQIAQERADHVEDLGNIQLDREEQLWQERIKRAQLETAMKYLPNMAMGGMGGFGAMPIAQPMIANPAMYGGMVPQGFGMPFGGMGLGGLGMGLGGQTNITTQTANAKGKPVNQSVANSNTLNHNVYSVGGMGHSPWGFGGFGGWLGGLLGGFF